MLHMYETHTAHINLCKQEHEFADESLAYKARGRTYSDEISTAAPSPEASPHFCPQAPRTSGGVPVLPPDCESFRLPEAQDLSSDAHFELTGFDDTDSTLDEDLSSDDCQRFPSSEEESSETEEDGDVAEQILDLLDELKAFRADIRAEAPRCSNALPRIPYPALEAGFLPTQLMPMQSWFMPPGSAQTGIYAQAMAPRPSEHKSMEPLNIVFCEHGARLEAASTPDECSSEHQRRRQSKAKAVLCKRAGRSRSPEVQLDEMRERGSAPRGRPRFKSYW